jgi:hypothetical protein
VRRFVLHLSSAAGSTALARVTLARMSVALAVQIKEALNKSILDFSAPVIGKV